MQTESASTPLNNSDISNIVSNYEWLIKAYVLEGMTIEAIKLVRWIGWTEDPPVELGLLEAKRYVESLYHEILREAVRKVMKEHPL